jgi:hypothetical protein
VHVSLLGASPSYLVVGADFNHSVLVYCSESVSMYYVERWIIITFRQRFRLKLQWWRHCKRLQDLRCLVEVSLLLISCLLPFFPGLPSLFASTSSVRSPITHSGHQCNTYHSPIACKRRLLSLTVTWGSALGSKRVMVVWRPLLYHSGKYKTRWYIKSVTHNTYARSKIIVSPSGWYMYCFGLFIHEIRLWDEEGSFFDCTNNS